MHVIIHRCRKMASSGGTTHPWLTTPIHLKICT